MEHKYITVKEAARILGVTPLTLRNWDRQGKLIAFRHPINNYRVYRLDKIEFFLSSIETPKKQKPVSHIKKIKIRTEDD